MKAQIDPQIDGGCDTFHLVSAATTNATCIKSTPGQVFGWYIYNSNASARKVNFYESGKVPNVGVSPLKFSLVIPASSGANVFSDIGIQFSQGISISTVTELTDAGTTAVALNDLIINIFYK